MQQDVLKEIVDTLSDIGQKTKLEEKQEYDTLNELFSLLEDVGLKVPVSITQPDRDNSLVYDRFAGLKFALLRCSTLILLGAYDASSRELRFILESTLHAYYLDKEHPEEELKCKLELIKATEEKNFGWRLISKLDLPKEKKEKLYNLYKELCKYVHVSYREMTNEKYIPVFKKDLLKENLHRVVEVLDACFFILLMRFSNLKPIFGKKKGPLKNNRFELTLEALKIDSNNHYSEPS